QRSPRRKKTPTVAAKRHRHPPQTGNLPDVEWRSIPMEHLRRHPNFEPLPLPSTIERLESLESVRDFRQDSWQWEALHAGRCTTSQAVAALGFLEPEAGEFLNVPRGWRKGGQRAYYRLVKPALRTLEEMNTFLCTQDEGNAIVDGTDGDGSATNGSSKSNPHWTTPSSFPFAAKYMVKTAQQELDKRRNLAKANLQSPGIEWSIRMIWGNTQEATALLTALNYFWKQDASIVLKEVGMCGAGLALNHTSTTTSTGMLIGATPDALLVHPDGRIEAVEVKNHCPFQPNFMSKRTNNRQRNADGGKDRFRILRMEFSHGVMPQYVPQLMMEMLCVGPECKSAVMVRQSALNGALILRIHRDDEWIEEMIYWLDRFHHDFVNPRLPPPTDFFFKTGSATDQERYVAFLERTKELESKVEILAHVPHGEVQRAIGSAPGPSNLFLDS
ncbi:MAG: hypothetical protein SGILL_006635, partial [Bacillariaceae sp.]